MKTKNKKYLIYGGVAFLVGSLGYFIYTTLRNKNSNVAENQTDTVTPETETTSGTNTFRDMLDNPTIPSGIDWKFQTQPIVPKGFFDIRKDVFMN